MGSARGQVPLGSPGRPAGTRDRVRQQRIQTRAQPTAHYGGGATMLCCADEWQMSEYTNHRDRDSRNERGEFPASTSTVEVILTCSESSSECTCALLLAYFARLARSSCSCTTAGSGMTSRRGAKHPQSKLSGFKAWISGLCRDHPHKEKHIFGCRSRISRRDLANGKRKWRADTSLIRASCGAIAANVSLHFISPSPVARCTKRCTTAGTARWPIRTRARLRACAAQSSNPWARCSTLWGSG